MECFHCSPSRQPSNGPAACCKVPAHLALPTASHGAISERGAAWLHNKSCCFFRHFARLATWVRCTMTRRTDCSSGVTPEVSVGGEPPPRPPRLPAMVQQIKAINQSINQSVVSNALVRQHRPTPPCSRSHEWYSVNSISLPTLIELTLVMMLPTGVFDTPVPVATSTALTHASSPKLHPFPLIYPFESSLAPSVKARTPPFGKHAPPMPRVQ